MSQTLPLIATLTGAIDALMAFDRWALLSAAAQDIAAVVTLGAVGIVLFFLLFLDRLSGNERDFCLRWLLILTFAAVVGLFARLWLGAVVQHGYGAALWRLESYTGLLRGAAGDAFALRLSGLVLMLLARRRSLIGMSLAMLGAGLVVLSFASGGHAGTAAMRQVSVLVLALHVSVAAFWLGSYGPLRCVLQRSDPRSAGDLLARWNRLMLWLVLLVAIAGAASVWLVFGSPLLLTSLPYGVTILAKVALFVILVAFGFINRQRHLRLMRTGDVVAAAHLRQSLGRERLVMLMMIVLSSEAAALSLLAGRP